MQANFNGVVGSIILIIEFFIVKVENMRIKKLKLYTKQLSLEKAFYTQRLGFSIIEEGENYFTISVGWSELTFESSEVEHIYHYCFLIPSNKLSEALEWMEKRVDLIDLEAEKKVQRFESWNADSFYFYDASGNIAEFIVRYDLNNEIDQDFNIEEVICLNEIGMPTRDVTGTNTALEHYFGTKLWKGDLERFGTNGTQEGLFLLPNYEIKEIWFPTTIKIKPEPFEIQFEHEGRLFFMEYKEEEIKYTVNT